jgi:hypothetical protein
MIMYAKIEGSEQERQLLEVLDPTGDTASDFRVCVNKQDGAWDLTLSIAPHDELNTSRGTGATFGDAWDSCGRNVVRQQTKAVTRMAANRADPLNV